MRRDTECNSETRNQGSTCFPKMYEQPLHNSSRHPTKFSLRSDRPPGICAALRETLDQGVTSLYLTYLSNKLAIQATGDDSKLWLIVSFLNEGGNQETKKLNFDPNPEPTQNSASHF